MPMSKSIAPYMAYITHVKKLKTLHTKPDQEFIVFPIQVNISQNLNTYLADGSESFTMANPTTGSNLVMRSKLIRNNPKYVRTEITTTRPQLQRHLPHKYPLNQRLLKRPCSHKCLQYQPIKHPLTNNQTYQLYQLKTKNNYILTLQQSKRKTLKITSN